MARLVWLVVFVTVLASASTACASEDSSDGNEKAPAAQTERTDEAPAETEPASPTEDADEEAVDGVREGIQFTEDAIQTLEPAMNQCARAGGGLCQVEVNLDAGLTNAQNRLDAYIVQIEGDVSAPCRNALRRVSSLNAKHEAILDRFMDLPAAQSAKLKGIASQNAQLTRQHATALQRARTACDL